MDILYPSYCKNSLNAFQELNSTQCMQATKTIPSNLGMPTSIRVLVLGLRKVFPIRTAIRLTWMMEGVHAFKYWLLAKSTLSHAKIFFSKIHFCFKNRWISTFLRDIDSKIISYNLIAKNLYSSRARQN
jgi:hypothetical protein